MKAEIREIEQQGWVLRLRYPPHPRPDAPLVLMLHGWTGDERSMWVFAPRLPPDAVLVAPRGPYPAAQGGYSWHSMRPRDTRWPPVNAFTPAARELLALLDGWVDLQSDRRAFHLVGFSQGAAMASVLTLLYPARVRSLAMLAGFLPHDAEAYRPALSGLPVFVAHGRTDEMVPLEEGHRTSAFFRALGAQVTFCESDGGHRLEAQCARALAAFFSDQAAG